MKTLLRKASLAGIGTVLFVLTLFTFVAVLAGLAFSDALIVGLLALILDVVILSLYLLAKQREAHKGKLENMSKRIDEKPDAHEVEKLIKRNKHEVADVVEKYTKSLYSQIEALNNIQLKVNLKKPLPSLTGGAASPELALKIMDIIENNQCKAVLDVGSGISSAVAGYAVKNFSEGKVLALDHEKEFYLKTKQLVKDHGLSNIVNVVHAPLKEYTLKNGKYQWYDDKELRKMEQIDLLLVDGPPGATQSNSRYPAMPILYEKLASQAIVIVDDYKREDENLMVESWLKDYPEFDLDIIDSNKGIAVLQRRTSS